MSGVIALAIIVATVYTLLELNRKSASIGIPVSASMINGYDEPGNNLYDPMNIRSNFNNHNPVVSTDVGPFGIKRKMRHAGNGDVIYDTYGEALEEY
jgi:hypothetical protein